VIDTASGQVELAPRAIAADIRGCARGSRSAPASCC
jgi:hypothetical protein